MQTKPVRLIDRLADPHSDMVSVLVLEAPHGVVIIGKDARIIRVNDTMRRLAGPACIPSACLPDLFSADDHDAVWNGLRSVLDDTAASTRFGGSLYSAAQVPVDVTCVPVREADGAVTGAVVHASDISQQDRLAAQVAHAHKQQLVGEFTSAIAHDFNNLLMTIMGAADEVVARGHLDAASRADLDQISRGGERGSALVRQLLSFAQPRPLQLGAVLIDDLVAMLARLARRLLGSAISLHVDLGAPGWFVRVDPAQIDHILLNLAVNARNAMPDGGVMTLTTCNAAILDDFGVQPGHYATVQVHDTGVGIAPEILPRVFEPFFTTRPGAGGTGLGLSTAQAMARRVNGFLRLDSVVGQGTRASLYLPAFRGDSPPVASSGPQSAAQQSTINARVALLVDDEEGARRLVVRALEKHGWHVLSAESGEAALTLLKSQPVAANLCIVITDFVLPGINGVALIQAVRQLRPELPAILTSGHPQSAIADWITGAMNAFMTKPYTLRDALALIERHAWTLRPNDIA